MLGAGTNEDNWEHPAAICESSQRSRINAAEGSR
jgi:hypothetical protein